MATLHTLAPPAAQTVRGIAVEAEQRGAEMEDSGISRRSFLYGSAAVVAGTLVGDVTGGWSADANSKPGVQMYMVLAEYRNDPAGTLAKLHSIGYGYLEAFAMPMVISDLAECRASGITFTTATAQCEH